MDARRALITGAVLAAIAVGAGAFGAHRLRSEVQRRQLESSEQTRQLEIWDTAVRYQMYHALGLLVIGLIGRHFWNRPLAIAAWLFLGGIAIFSGGLYALVLTGVKVLGAIVPIGGVAMIAGWIAVAMGAATQRERFADAGQPS